MIAWPTPMTRSVAAMKKASLLLVNLPEKFQMLQSDTRVLVSLLVYSKRAPDLADVVHPG